MTNDRSRRGSAMIEFTLVGIGLIFVLISIAEMSRGMWVYHTLAHVAKEGNRYAIVHGRNCEVLTGCQPYITRQALAQKMQYAGVGLMAANVEVTISIQGV